MVCFSPERFRAGIADVSSVSPRRSRLDYTPNLTGEKHTISTLVDQTHIQLTHQRSKNRIFFKTSLVVLNLQVGLQQVKPSKPFTGINLHLKLKNERVR